MQTKTYALMSMLLFTLTIVFASTIVYAAETCAPLVSPQCGDFGGNTIKFLNTQPATCNLPAGSATFVPCTAYSYLYMGSPTNQINVAIPKAVMTKFTSADKAVAGC